MGHEIDHEYSEFNPDTDLSFESGDIIIATDTRGHWFEGYLETDPSRTVKKLPSSFVSRHYEGSGKRYLTITFFEADELIAMDALSGNDVYVNVGASSTSRSPGPLLSVETLMFGLWRGKNHLSKLSHDRAGQL